MICTTLLSCARSICAYLAFMKFWNSCFYWSSGGKRFTWISSFRGDSPFSRSSYSGESMIVACFLSLLLKKERSAWASSGEPGERSLGDWESLFSLLAMINRWAEFARAELRSIRRMGGVPFLYVEAMEFSLPIASVYLFCKATSPVTLLLFVAYSRNSEDLCFS